MTRSSTGSSFADFHESPLPAAGTPRSSTALPTERQREIGMKIDAVTPLIPVELQFEQMSRRGLPQNTPRAFHRGGHRAPAHGRANNPHSSHLAKPGRVL